LAGFGGTMAGLAGYGRNLDLYNLVLETIFRIPPLFSKLSFFIFIYIFYINFTDFWRVWRDRPLMAGFGGIMAGLAGYGFIFVIFMIITYLLLF